LSKYKVYIIDEVHMLTTQAFNALLKTLEEPPSHAIFILATTEPYKIPMTVLSRCQRFQFCKLDSSCLIKRLEYIVQEEKIEITNEALAEVARIADGGMRDAINILDQLKINLVPSLSKYKVYIIDEVHMLTTQAFNALLKTIIVKKFLILWKKLIMREKVFLNLLKNL